MDAAHPRDVYPRSTPPASCQPARTHAYRRSEPQGSSLPPCCKPHAHTIATNPGGMRSPVVSARKKTHLGNSGASTSCSAALGASRHCRSLPWPPGFFRAGPVVCVKEMVLWSCGRGEGQSFWYYVGCKGFSDCDPVKTAVLGSGPGAPPFGRHIQLVTVTLLEVTLLNKIRSSLET